MSHMNDLVPFKRTRGQTTETMLPQPQNNNSCYDDEKLEVQAYKTCYTTGMVKIIDWTICRTVQISLVHEYL